MPDTHQEIDVDLFEAVTTFMQRGQQKPGTFDAKAISLYTGLQCEELAEKLEAMQKGAIDDAGRRVYDNVIEALSVMSVKLKGDMVHGDILRADRAEMGDADIDLAWVSIGALLKTANGVPHALRAIKRVNAANLAKVPEGGTRFDANGKIMKPQGWKAPDITEFFGDKFDDS